MLTKTAFKFEVKAVDDKGSFEGLVAVFGNIDLGNDRIEKGAFTETLKQYGNDNMPPILWQHDDRQPIGVHTDMEETDAGLYIKGQLVLGVKQADEAHLLLKAKAVRGMSLGYNTRKSTREGDVRILKQLDYHEGSIVTFPMNPKARVSAVKNVRDFEHFLVRDAGFSRSQAHTIINEGFKALPDMRDADDETSELIKAIERNSKILQQ